MPVLTSKVDDHVPDRKTTRGVPDGVKIAVADGKVAVEGPLGNWSWSSARRSPWPSTPPAKTWWCSRKATTASPRALHGLTRAMIQNMFVGVTAGLREAAGDRGRGLHRGGAEGRAAIAGGLANELQKPIPAGLTVTCPDQQHVLIKGIDKQMVTHFAAEVRACGNRSRTKAKASASRARQVRRKQGKATVK